MTLPKIELIRPRQLIFTTQLAKTKMELYCKLCPDEIGWLATVDELPNGAFLITDCYLFTQKVHAATTEIDPGSLLDFWYNEDATITSKIKAWGHSHVNMAPSPSGQDDSQMEYFKDGNDYYIRIITNKSGAYHITFYDWTSRFETKIIQDELPIYDPNADELEAVISAEIKEKVSKIVTTSTYKPVPSTTTGYRGYNYGTTYQSSYYEDKDDYVDLTDYSTHKKKESKKTEKEKVNKMYTDVPIKYITDFNEALDDEEYWAIGY